MFVNLCFLATNPFFSAYVQSDWLGKMIFLALFILSIVSWVLLIYKVILLTRVKKEARVFYSTLQKQKGSVLSFEREGSGPFATLFFFLKKQTIELLSKNFRFRNPESELQEEKIASLSPADINFIESQVLSRIAFETQRLDKHMFILSTVVSLAPFLGLLGTVWGILGTFSELQMNASGGVQQMALGGLSLALATTVLGLIDAIPALIGYNYLKADIQAFDMEMRTFSTEVLASIELQYRHVDTRV